MFSAVEKTNRSRLDDLFNREEFTSDMRELFYGLVEGTDFFTAPASTRYHGSYPGGLFDHCFAMAQLLLDWTKKGLITWGRYESPIIVGLLHDFTKVGKYKVNLNFGEGPDKQYEFSYNSGSLTYGGHGSDSLIKVSLQFPLTQEEALCIRYHMGAYEGKEAWGEFDRAIRRYQTVLWTHHADMVASKVLEV